jgi:AcrR family transcriptional regulator
VGSSYSPQSAQALSGARRREATQRDILAAARKLLVDGEPFTTLSIDRIATTAGVSRATVYLHFADKQDILARLAEEIVEQRFAIGAELVADPELDRAALDRIVADMVARWARDAPLLSAIIELAEYDPGMRATWVGAVDTVAAMGAELMRARWQDSPATAPDVETVGQVLAWMFERSAHQLARQPARHAAVSAAMAEVVWRVLDYRPTPR